MILIFNKLLHLEVKIKFNSQMTKEILKLKFRILLKNKIVKFYQNWKLNITLSMNKLMKNKIAKS